jgi:hypothetical protein
MYGSIDFNSSLVFQSGLRLASPDQVTQLVTGIQDRINQLAAQGSTIFCASTSSTSTRSNDVDHRPQVPGGLAGKVARPGEKGPIAGRATGGMYSGLPGDWYGTALPSPPVTSESSRASIFSNMEPSV